MTGVLLPALLLCLVFQVSSSEAKTYWLNGETFVKHHLSDEELTIFCNSPHTAKFYHLWHSLSLNISLSKIDEVYWGPNTSSVRQQYMDNYSQWFSLWNVLWKCLPGSINSKRNTVLQFETFSESCIGIVAKDPFIANSLFQCEPMYVALTMAGIVLFIYAERISRNIAFYYTCGASVSILASLLIIIVVIHRLLPMRRFLYVLLSMGGALSAFIWSKIIHNLEVILLAYSTYVILYLTTMGLLGFSLIYWYGPPENSSRTVVLVRWFIRIVALFLIFCSVQIPVYSLTIIGILLLSTVFNPMRKMKFHMGGVVHLILYRYYRFFPPKRRYFSSSEYSDIVSKQTKLALAELREYCQSPKCNSWEVIGRLKSPAKLASFVSNGSHISPEEKEAYESMLLESSNSDDDSSISWDDQENQHAASRSKAFHFGAFRRHNISTPLQQSFPNISYCTDGESD